jgi:serine/threonine-protein kinase
MTGDTMSSEANAAAPKRGNPKRWLVVVGVVLVLTLVVAAALYLKPTVVPDLQLKPKSEAEALLEHAGLEMGRVGEVATTTVGPGLVIAQSPNPGERTRSNRSVDVTLAAVSVLARVPDVIGSDAESAARVLEDAMFLAHKVDILDSEAGVGTVLAQMPDGGAEWMTGRPVALAVAAGADDGTGTKVPDVVGMTFDQAFDELANAGLLGYGVVLDPMNYTATDVHNQLPAAGVVVRQGTTVVLSQEQ